MGIKSEDQSFSDCIEYGRSFSAYLTKVVKGDTKMALITNDISIDDVKTVCNSGCTRPQKSTHFWPKVICGFDFSSL
jgi:uncharacterized protein (DUF1015 family)